MHARGVALIAAVVVALAGMLALARPGADPVPAATGSCAVRADPVPGAAESGLEVRPLCALPVEAAQVWARIGAGGPYPHERDGAVFGNRERLLPERARGFYREYTVPTPGEDDRGARRFVTGGGPGPDRQLYYTADHYASFVVVDATAVR